MPNPRASAAVDDPRLAPPASEGIIAPSSALVRQEARDRREYKRTPGPKDDAEGDAIVDITLQLMEKMSAPAIARRAAAEGHPVDSRSVTSIIRAARRSLAERAEFYVEAHGVATIRAAIEGDAKPAQWALDRIAEEGERIIDAPQAEAAVAPTTFNIGFKMGGLPEGVTVAPLAIEGEVAK